VLNLKTHQVILKFFHHLFSLLNNLVTLLGTFPLTGDFSSSEFPDGVFAGVLGSMLHGGNTALRFSVGRTKWTGESHQADPPLVVERP
jgi:hypothetical protein